MSNRIKERRLQPLALLERFGLTGTFKGVLQLVIEPLDLLFSGLGFFGSALGARRKLPRSKRRDQECEERNPVVRIANRERAERWQKKEIEAGDSQQRSKHCRARTPRRGHEENYQKKSESRGSGIDVGTE